MNKTKSLRHYEINDLSATVKKPLKTDYIKQATSHNTRKDYQSDINHFIKWGGVLPTKPYQIIQYLEAFAFELNPNTLSRRLTAIKLWHQYQDFKDPTDDPKILKTLKGIRRTHGRPEKKASPITLNILKKMLEYLSKENTLKGLRDKSLLLIGFFGAFRRSELVNIHIEDVKIIKEGLEILIPFSKTDTEGRGEVCFLPRMDNQLCPVNTLELWLEKTKITNGAIFKFISKENEIKERAIHVETVNHIIKSVAKAINLPEANNYRGHSLRRGFATTASQKGVSLIDIMRHGRWKSQAIVTEYIESSRGFQKEIFKKII